MCGCAGTGVGDAGATALSRSTSVTGLYLGGRWIGRVTVRAGLGRSWPWCPSPDTNLTKHGAKHLVEALHSYAGPCLQSLHCDYSLANFDDNLPDGIKRYNRRFGNAALLQYYRAHAQARIRRRVAAVAVLRTAWHRSHGRPVRDTTGDEAQPTRAAALAHMVQLRRMCRVREGKDEVVEPFGRCMMAYL